MENIDLKKLSAEQLCDLFNDETPRLSIGTLFRSLSIGKYPQSIFNELRVV